MDGFLPIFFLLVVLKVPVLAAMWLVWWAGRATKPETAGDDGDDGFGRRRPEPVLPRGPRRGPHSSGARQLPEHGGRRRTRPASRPAYAPAAPAVDTGGSQPRSCAS